MAKRTAGQGRQESGSSAPPREPKVTPVGWDQAPLIYSDHVRSSIAPLPGGPFVFLTFCAHEPNLEDNSVALVARARVQLAAQQGFSVGAMLIRQLLTVSEIAPEHLDQAIETLEQQLEILRTKKKDATGVKKR